MNVTAFSSLNVVVFLIVVNEVRNDLINIYNNGFALMLAKSDVKKFKPE